MLTRIGNPAPALVLRARRAGHGKRYTIRTESAPRLTLKRSAPVSAKLPRDFQATIHDAPRPPTTPQINVRRGQTGSAPGVPRAQLDNAATGSFARSLDGRLTSTSSPTPLDAVTSSRGRPSRPPRTGTRCTRHSTCSPSFRSNRVPRKRIMSLPIYCHQRVLFATQASDVTPTYRPPCVRGHWDTTSRRSIHLQPCRH